MRVLLNDHTRIRFRHLKARFIARCQEVVMTFGGREILVVCSSARPTGRV